MRGVANPPPGTIFYGCHDRGDGRIVVCPMSRNAEGRLVHGEPVDEFTSTRAAMARTEELNRLHREVLCDNIINSRAA
jgi:hypothetical protein